MNVLIKSLRLIGSLVPSWLPHGTAIGNRILKPIYKYTFGSRMELFTLWDGINLQGNPTQCVDGNLFFHPQLYDKDERELIKKYLKHDDVFLDIGANIGAYSLWAAKHLSNKGKILAIEADPVTFSQLQHNCRINDMQCTIITKNIGVSDKNENLPFYRNKDGNFGGNSFFTLSNNEADEVLEAESLFNIIKQESLTKISFIKIDIEGFELKVLSKFFNDCFESKYPLPSYILIETEEGPRGKDSIYLNQIKLLFARYDYNAIYSSKNTIYSLQ